MKLGMEVQRSLLGATVSPASYANRVPWGWLLFALILSLSTVRFIYLAWLSPLDLAPDEAHYWDWSRHLDWSYYSKGPLVAWIIRGAIELFGPLSIRLTGHETMAVRMPAVFFGSLLLLGLYVLSLQVFRSPRVAFLTALFAATMPAIAAVSILMTIDSPFLCLWTWALVAGHRAVSQNDTWAWLLTGLLVCLGILAKYTMGLWLVSLGLFLVTTPTLRPILFRRGFWLMVAVASFSAIPILYWNSTHDWVTFRHVGGQAGVVQQTGIRWLGPLEYIGSQFGLMIGYWFVVWIASMIHYRPKRENDLGVQYLWWMSAPTFLLFGAVTFRSAGQVNWPAAAYLSGIVLASAWLMHLLDTAGDSFRRLTRYCIIGACALGVAVNVAVHETLLIRPVALAIAERLRPNDPLAIRGVDPTARLRGWRYLGKEVDRIRAEVRETDGIEPLMSAGGWNTAGEVGFYCEGHPTVYSFGLYFGGRHSQYDFWRPNPVDDAQVFAGKTFIVVTADETILRQAFTDVSPAREFIYKEDGVALAAWQVWICRGFRGIDLKRGPGHY